MSDLTRYAVAFFVMAVFCAFCALEDMDKSLKILCNYGINYIEDNKKKKTKSELIRELLAKGASEGEVQEFKDHQRYKLIFETLAAGFVGVYLCINIFVLIQH